MIAFSLAESMEETHLNVFQGRSLEVELERGGGCGQAVVGRQHMVVDRAGEKLGLCQRATRPGERSKETSK